jgi:Helix-turn-helix domain
MWKVHWRRSWDFSPDLEIGPMATRSEGARQRAMKARDAARYIGCGRTKLKQLIASGAFAGAFKLGRDHVLPVADLDAFVDAQAAAARAARSKAPLPLGEDDVSLLDGSRKRPTR